MKKLEQKLEPPCEKPKEHRERHYALPIFFCKSNLNVECPYRVRLRIMPGKSVCVYREEN